MSSPPGVTEAERQEVLDAVPASVPFGMFDPRAKEHGQTLRFRDLYGWTLLAALVAQLMAADVVFVLYAAWGVHWRIPSAVMSAWLSATVVEVIGVVYVITKSLFPLRDPFKG